MYSFKNDYSEGMHPRILKALAETNMIQEEGYGLDRFSLEAAGLLEKKMGNPGSDIHFLTGGTQTNLTALGAFLRPHEAVVAADTGHINVHEAGSVEATGHKVLTAPSPDGKLSPGLIQPVLDEHAGDEHMVKPRLVYVSQTTELGTVYTRGELNGLREFCEQNDLFLYLDGARLGTAITCGEEVPGFEDLARCCHAFYIGGTKNGAMSGEALVIIHDSLKADFRYLLKQRGALAAKGRFLGIQFLELFRDDLYFELAFHANRMARLLREGLTARGVDFLVDSPTNQLFPILPDALIEKLEKEYGFYRWQPMGEGKSAVRLVTSWATEEENVKAFLARAKAL